MPISPIWPAATAVDANGAIAFHGRAAARLKLNDAVQQVIANGLDLLGVTAPEKM